jgi:hypothetical protein
MTIIILLSILIALGGASLASQWYIHHKGQSVIQAVRDVEDHIRAFEAHQASIGRTISADAMRLINRIRGLV